LKIPFLKYWLNKSVVKTILFLVLSSGLNQISAQEIIRYPSNDNANDNDTIVTKIDSTAKPPIYRNGESDFFAYLELFLGRPEWANYFTPIGDVVVFEFIVKSDGSIENFKIISSSNLSMNIPLRQAIEKMDNWQPRIKEGKKVSTLMVYSLNIRSVLEFPYIEIRKDRDYEPTEPANKYIKWFLVIGAVLIMSTLLIISK